MTLPCTRSFVSSRISALLFLKNWPLAFARRNVGDQCKPNFENREKEIPQNEGKVVNSNIDNITSQKISHSDLSNTKIIKVAIVGLPNAGKSTIINTLIGRNACPISRKVHTTREKVRAIGVEENTQIIFLDTPGLVTADESKKYKLESSFLHDSEESIAEADIVGVVHDISHKHSLIRERLDPKVLRLLHLIPSNTTSFLIINKIDLVTKKYVMLKIIKRLTLNSMNSESMERKPMTEHEIVKEVENQTGWPYFSEVFLVSALTGSGMADIKHYIMSKAKPGPWLYPKHQFIEDEPENLIKKVVQSTLLELLPQELGYVLKTQIEHFHENEMGHLVCVMLIQCPTIRLERVILGHQGSLIRKIARRAEEELVQTFYKPFYLKLVVEPPLKC